MRRSYQDVWRGLYYIPFRNQTYRHIHLATDTLADRQTCGEDHFIPFRNEAERYADRRLERTTSFLQKWNRQTDMQTDKQTNENYLTLPLRHIHKQTCWRGPPPSFQKSYRQTDRPIAKLTLPSSSLSYRHTCRQTDVWRGSLPFFLSEMKQTDRQTHIMKLSNFTFTSHSLSYRHISMQTNRQTDVLKRTTAFLSEIIQTDR